MDLLAAKRVPVLIASQGGPRRYLPRFDGTGTICLHVVASVEHAAKAVGAGVDGLVAVGAEAGGHPPPDLVSTLVITRAIVQAAPNTPVIASGGFADGSGLAAALALGAGAAQFGTRFLASSEATVHSAYKEAVLAASVAAPARSGAASASSGPSRTRSPSAWPSWRTPGSTWSNGGSSSARRRSGGPRPRATPPSERWRPPVGGPDRHGTAAAEIVRRLTNEYRKAHEALPAVHD